MQSQSDKPPAAHRVHSRAQPASSPDVMPADAADADLARLVDVVVHEFNGDTSAFFESIRPADQQHDGDKQTEEIEYKTAHRSSKRL